MGELLGLGALLFGALLAEAVDGMNEEVHCVWFKRDLRVLDHAPLAEAVRAGRVLPLYLVEPDIIQAPDFDAMHWKFIRESLVDLQRSLRALGAELQVRIGNAVDVFTDLHESFRLQCIWAHEETGNAITYQRDLAVASWAQAAGIALHQIPQNGVVHRLKDRDGWSRHWERRMQAPIVPIPEQVEPVFELKPCELPSVAELGLHQTPRQLDLVGGRGRGSRHPA